MKKDRNELEAKTSILRQTKYDVFHSLNLKYGSKQNEKANPENQYSDDFQLDRLLSIVHNN